MYTFWSIVDFLSENLVFVVQNDGVANKNKQKRWKNAENFQYIKENVLFQISFLLCLVIVFNISLPQTRKDSIVEQLSSQGTGLFIMVFIFFMTWGFAYPAYIRDPNSENPDFFPIFTLLNSWTGVFVFCLLGIVSKPFRATILGGGGLRVRIDT